MPATVHESTKISCTAPPSYVNRKTILEISLNNQQFTDDNQVYSYYKPPYVFDTEPRQGPTRGGTDVVVVGTNFKEGVPVKCKFGDHETAGSYISKHKVSCAAPPHGKAEFVTLSISFEKDMWSSGQTKYLYYDQPSINKIEPTCGPESGYTEITVFGKNFINLGLGNVHCVFNRTVHMNATVMEHDIIQCDSPPAVGWYKSNENSNEPKFYYVEITLDGVLYGGPPQKFTYYKDPDITAISPNLGPIEGGTEIKIDGLGFAQRNVCNMTVRFGNIYTTPTTYGPNQIIVRSPRVHNADSVVVAIGLNGQQFTKDKTLHFKDPENTYHYYENPVIYDFSPDKGLSNGGTNIKIRGRGFQPTKYENGTFIDTPVYVRMLEAETRKPLAPTTIADYTENEEIHWKAPPAPAGTKGIISLSLNNHQFYELYHKDAQFSFEYLSSPFVDSIDPEFGEVRHSDHVTIDVHGRNFDCPGGDCSNVVCKFGKDPDAITVNGKRQSSTLIQCPLPNYPQPDVLDVEVAVNGKDFSNNKKQFGYFDPFVLRVEPKLINKDGTTRIEIKGFGFVDSSKVGGLKVLYDNDASQYYCTSTKNKCVVDAIYIDKNKIETATLPYDMYRTESNEKIGDFDPINVEVSVFNDKFTKNHIKVHYYDAPVPKGVVPQGAPANTQTPLMILTDFKFKTNNPDVFMEYAVFKCRFRSQDGREEIFTQGQAIAHPYKIGAEPTHIKCNTPIWPLAGRNTEQVILDVTSNGFDYVGNFGFVFSDKMEIYRVSPLSGPNEGGTDVKLVGSGFKPQEDVMVKWGVVNMQLADKGNVQSAAGQTFMKEKDFSSSSETVIPIHQRKIDNQKTYDSLMMKSPKLGNWHQTNGGPIYLEIGAREDISNSPSELGKYAYTTSFAEYYYYKQPVVKNIHPHGGPIEGGTEIVIEGAHFEFLPEYGVVPHCQIGDKIAEAKYESSVRIICPSPPGDSVDKKYPIKISLNGEDFIDTGKFFHYYKNSQILSIHPTSGPNTGGTTIKITGEHFSDLSNQNEFLCKFEPLNTDIPAKYISARYFNQTTILCASPGGFGNVDTVKVDVSFNGIDYTKSNKEFRYYNIITSSPKSGPTNGKGANVHIRGQGFKDDGNIKCKLDNIEYQPSHIEWDEIQCPVLESKKVGSVPFEATVNGDDWHKFDNFEYYEQPTVSSIYPKSGPNVGHGKIHFYGEKFVEFKTAEVYCKVGDSYGKAKIIDKQNLECEISELPLTGSENAYPAQISLNNASWTEVSSGAQYNPYGIHHITPNSGPIDGGTEITVYGSGFKNGGSPQCRFGVPGDYAIVSGKVLSHDKMVCNSPAGYNVPKQASLPFSVPFSISFNKEEYDPWTQSAHRFRFYDQPYISGCTPTQAEVGESKSVQVFSNQNTEFIQPIPIEGSQYSDYGIFCKFGKYGSTPGALVSPTEIKCGTPTIQKSPEDLDKETVILSVAQNGQNFNEMRSNCDFTFTGTGDGSSFWPWILAMILIFILIIALLLCIAAIIQHRSKHHGRVARGYDKDREEPHVLGHRPRGTATGPMEYKYDRPNENLFGGIGNTNENYGRSNFNGTDRYDTRSKHLI